MIRAVFGAMIGFGLLYMADQEFADLHYSRIAVKAATKVRHTIGI